MAENAKNKKGLIIGICAAVVVVVAIVVGIVFAVRNGAGGLNDAYFQSDGTKYVLTLESDEMSFDDEEYTPLKTHLVYTYSGDEITGLMGYYEYENDDAAKAAYNYLLESQSDDYKSISLDGKYVVIEADESEYEDLTAEDVKQQIEFMEMMRNMNTDSSESTETDEVVEEETTEEVQE